MDAGNVSVIQMKDLTDRNRVDSNALTLVDMEKPKEHHLVKPGDLIFRSRGLTTNSAILLDDPGTAVVAAPLLRIRVKDRNIYAGVSELVYQPEAGTNFFFESGQRNHSKDDQ